MDPLSRGIRCYNVHFCSNHNYLILAWLLPDLIKGELTNIWVLFYWSFVLERQHAVPWRVSSITNRFNTKKGDHRTCRVRLIFLQSVNLQQWWKSLYKAAFVSGTQIWDECGAKTDEYLDLSKKTRNLQDALTGQSCIHFLDPHVEPGILHNFYSGMCPSYRYEREKEANVLEFGPWHVRKSSCRSFS